MRRRLQILLAMTMVGVTAFAQTLKVRGIVVDENNEAVIGASILIKGSNTGTKTDINGQFELPGVKSGAKLDVSYIGMKSQTVTAKTEMKIVLENDDQVLDEVMVVAFGEQKKSSFTGSAGVVDIKKLEQRQVTNVMEHQPFRRGVGDSAQGCCLQRALRCERCQRRHHRNYEKRRQKPHFYIS